MAVELETDLLLPIPLRENALDVFSGIADMAAHLGRRMNLVTIVAAHGESTLQTRIVKGIGKPRALYFTPTEIDAGLDAFLDVLTGRDVSRRKLAWTMLAQDPAEEIKEAGRETRRWEWPTTKENILLGMEEIVSDEGVTSTFYVRGLEHDNGSPISRIKYLLSRSLSR